MRYTKGRFAIPELPEVETVRRELAPWLTGSSIRQAARVNAPAGPKYANLDLATTRVIQDVKRRGKFLLLPLNTLAPNTSVPNTSTSNTSTQSNILESAALELVIHLGMTGKVIRAEDSPKQPMTHVRVQLELVTAEGRPSTLLFEDVRRFGRFLVVPAGDYQSLPTLHQMGLEPFDPTLTDQHFKTMLSRSTTAIKTYLLSQKPIAGVGNIYADEALWQARIHPETPSAWVSLDKARKLLAALREVLAKSIEVQGTTLRDYRTVNGEVGQFSNYLNVYGKAEEPCPRCGKLLSRSVIGGRSSHFCASCQQRRRKPPTSVCAKEA
ncbi:MAG: bifunctional DNA-formamidopyrimidine glycosylase/DNA-(apurinic or apyrimidinic site) lyase [Deinococcota bacterium]